MRSHTLKRNNTFYDFTHGNKLSICHFYYMLRWRFRDYIRYIVKKKYIICRLIIKTLNAKIKLEQNRFGFLKAFCHFHQNTPLWKHPRRPGSLDTEILKRFFSFSKPFIAYHYIHLHTHFLYWSKEFQFNLYYNVNSHEK